MAQNVVINSVTYQAVPSVTIPKSGGGNAVFYDTADATATAANTLAGIIGYNSSGKYTGSLTTVSVSQDGTTKVLTIS